VIVIAAQFLRRDPSQVGQLPYGQEEVKGESANPQPKGLSLGQAIRTKRFWMYTFAQFCFVICLMSIMTHTVPHATDIGISAAQAANILAIIGGAGILGRVAMGSLADRIGAKQAFAICFALLSAILVVLLLAKEAWLFYLFGAVFGIAYGGIAALIGPLIADLFGLRAHGTILGVSSFGGTLGGAIGPVMTGRIFDVTGSYQLAFIIFIILSVVALTVVSLLKPPSEKSS